MGSQRELINIPGAQLYLIDGEESVLMMSGGFSLKLLKQTRSPLAVVVANVGEVQWPVGKDAPVLKVWNWRYTFALPGLVYGMILPDTTPIAVLNNFEAILSEYSTFETHHEIANAAQYFATSGGRDNPGFWTAVAPEVETLSSRVARNIDSTSTIVANSIVMGGDWAALGMKHGATWMKRKAGRPQSPPEGGGDSGVSPRMMKRMQQARRMSAVAKLMSRTLLKGAISATGHVSKSLGLDVNASSVGPVYGSPDDTARNVAVASVDAFGKVVEAVETAGKSLYDVTQRVGTDIVQDRFGHEASQVVQDSFGAVGNVINTAWTLNKMGVKMLLRMTAASTALSARSGNAKSATSTVTDDQSLSPSKSTGSMPTKKLYSPPRTLHHEISLSTQEVAPSNPLHLLSPSDVHSGQQLHTSQLFPTSAEQMRNLTTVGVPATSPVYMPTANYAAGIISPAPRSNSPFQQYNWNVPEVRAPFSFQPAGANMQIE
ncbi:hypothetical protein KC19_5G095100 [Ceratodon purpureus]|uniref:Senescence domain-containing protein n=1 Tax=Ceratodon purpureus TaxID=3225 RepID=A0A8T0HZL4_CERPU|nr:hypothetical protein KC19_5G095100 [Ceratodon purpureus]